MLAEEGAGSKRDWESVCVGRLESVRTTGADEVSSLNVFMEMHGGSFQLADHSRTPIYTQTFPPTL